VEAPAVQVIPSAGGALLDVTPREFDLKDVRWGNCDRSFLAALNAPGFVSADAVASRNGGPAADEDGPRRYADDDQVVFGFRIGDQATPYRGR